MSERWIITYADMLTLLFAVFVCLYALGLQDKAKASMLQASIQEALDRPLSQKVIYKPPTVKVPTTSPRHPGSQSYLDAKKKCMGGPARGTYTPSKTMAIRKMSADLRKLTEDPKLDGKIEVKQVNEREVLVRLSSAGFFETGGEDLNADAQEFLAGLAASLRKYKKIETRVEGHTDNIPIRGLKYPSNWELSATRASSVVRALVDRYKMDPTTMMAVGYGEHHPVSTNDTPEGRKKNRRIDILIRQPQPKEEANMDPKPYRGKQKQAWQPVSATGLLKALGHDTSHSTKADPLPGGPGNESELAAPPPSQQPVQPPPKAPEEPAEPGEDFAPSFGPASIQ